MNRVIGKFTFLLGSLVAAFSVSAAESVFDGGLSAKFAQNVVTYAVTIADPGAGATVGLKLYAGTAEDSLAEVSGQGKTVTAPGSVSFTADFPFLTGTVYAKVVADIDDADGSRQEETAVLKTEMVDNTTYTWKEGVTEGEWTDPGNWIPSVDNPYTSYPNSSKARANFKNCTVPTTVYVTGSVRVDIIQDDKKATLDLTFKTSTNSTEMATINVWATWWDGFGESEITIDGINYLCHDGKYMEFKKLLVTNGATYESSQEVKHHKGGAVIEVSNKSKWIQANWTLSMSGEDTVFILDDSTFTQKNGGQLYLARNSGGGGDTIVVRGKHPVFDCDGVIVCRDGDPAENMKHTKVIFEIPEGGYEEPPFKRGTFLSGGKVMTDVLIDPKSPAFAVGTKGFSTKLVETTGGINKPWISRDGQAKADRFAFRYEGGTADAPTTMWLDYRPKALCVFIR